VSIKDNEWSTLKIYLAKTRNGTIKNLQAAYTYNKEKNQKQTFLNLMNKIRNMNESAFEDLSTEILSR